MGLRLPSTPLAYRWALAICVLAIAYLAFAPLERVIGTDSDKLNHVLAFAVLAWLAAGAYPGRRLLRHRWGFLLGYGLVIELVQGLLPVREFSLLDLAADALGILVYSMAAAWYRSPRTG